MGSDAWSNDSLDELTAPNNVPFLPGNNVTGFGSQVPAELAALGFNNAIVFFSDDWNPAATVPTAKFKFIAAQGGSLITGYGYCANPSVSQVATVVSSTTLGLVNNSGAVSDFEFRNSNSVTIFQFTTFGGGGVNDPAFLMYDGEGTVRGAWFHLASTLTATLGMGNFQLNVADGANDASVVGNILGDGVWTALPLTGGWTGDAVRVPLVRKMCDGTVQMKGLITKVANPVNGESWITGLATKFRPLHTWTFLTPTPGRAYNGSQVVEVRADGTGVIFDMAAASGVICLDGVRYANI